MNRRNFLKSLALAASGLYLPTKSFFLPPAGGWIESGDVQIWDVWYSQEFLERNPLLVKDLREQRLTHRVIFEAHRRLHENLLPPAPMLPGSFQVLRA